MANPNIAAATTFYGRTELQVTTTTPTAIAANDAASGKVFKINSLLVTNVTSAVASITADILRDTTAVQFAAQIPVPPKSVLVLLAKENPVYLLENDALRLSATMNNALHCICSFEEISV